MAVYPLIAIVIFSAALVLPLLNLTISTFAKSIGSRLRVLSFLASLCIAGSLTTWLYFTNFLDDAKSCAVGHYFASALLTIGLFMFHAEQLFNFHRVMKGSQLNLLIALTKFAFFIYELVVLTQDQPASEGCAFIAVTYPTTFIRAHIVNSVFELLLLFQLVLYYGHGRKGDESFFYFLRTSLNLEAYLGLVYLAAEVVYTVIHALLTQTARIYAQLLFANIPMLVLFISLISNIQRNDDKTIKVDVMDGRAAFERTKLNVVLAKDASAAELGIVKTAKGVDSLEQQC